MPAERLLPSDQAAEVVALAREYSRAELAPRAASAEEDAVFPREVFRDLGRLGLLGMPYPEAVGGGDQPFEIYLQVLEEIAGAWASVAVGISVHAMSCFPLYHAGSDDQRARWLPEMLGGDRLGAYSLSEADAGSDPGAMRARATRRAERFAIRGEKAWVTHGGVADFYTLFARTSDDGSSGISCFLLPGDVEGLSAGPPERKMGLNGSRTAHLALDDVEVDPERLIGELGQGLRIALEGLNSGRLGIAAVAIGLAQASLDLAVEYAGERESFGRPIISHQGVGFILADMAAAVETARAMTLEAARRRDLGMPFGRQAAIAKLVASDMAMRVTTDAVQVLGGIGYSREVPAERFMREAKVMQIFEGTNQIQRLIIARHLNSKGRPRG